MSDRHTPSNERTLLRRARELLGAFRHAYEPNNPFPLLEEIDRFLESSPETSDDSHAFKNFHRALCERFDYVHDEKDWRRDQVSLIEWIAEHTYSRSDVEALCAIAIAGRGHAETLQQKTDAVIDWAKRRISAAVQEGFSEKTSGESHG